MKKKIFLPLVLILALALAFCGCSEDEEISEEKNPDGFDYDMLDLSLVADEIYESSDLSELTRQSVSAVTDETVLSEQYYLDLSKVVSFEIRSAEGKYGVADVALIRAEEGAGDEIAESLEKRKDDRINEFLRYDVYDSYETALDAEIFQSGEMVIMLMLSEDDKASAFEILYSYLP